MLVFRSRLAFPFPARRSDLKITLKSVVQIVLPGLLGIGSNLISQAPARSSQIPLDRKIELMVRSKYQVPSDCQVKVGARSPSSVPGYDQLRVTVSQGQRSTNVDLLISSDDKKLGRLETFDLDQNPALSIDIIGRPTRGNPEAPITVVSFDDLECPACAFVHQQLFPEALNRYGEKVRFVYLDNPLIEIHPWALHAAVDAACMAHEGPTAYWNYVDYVHTHVQEVSGDSRTLQRSMAELDRIASEQASKQNLDSPRLQACLRVQDETPVRQSMKQAAGLGLNYTPAIFVDGEEVRGLRSIDDVWRVIDRTLKQSEAQSNGSAKN